MISGQNFEMVAGDSKIIEIAVEDEKGEVLPLTGASVEWLLKASEDDSTNLLRKVSADGGVTIPSPETGKFRVNLAAIDTAALTRGVYYHCAIITETGDVISSVTEGWITVEKKKRT